MPDSILRRLLLDHDIHDHRLTIWSHHWLEYVEFVVGGTTTTSTYHLAEKYVPCNFRNRVWSLGWSYGCYAIRRGRISWFETHDITVHPFDSGLAVLHISLACRCYHTVMAKPIPDITRIQWRLRIFPRRRRASLPTFSGDRECCWQFESSILLVVRTICFLDVFLGLRLDTNEQEVERHRWIAFTDQ